MASSEVFLAGVASGMEAANIEIFVRWRAPLESSDADMLCSMRWIKTFWSPDRLPSAVNLLAQTTNIRYLKELVGLVIASASHRLCHDRTSEPQPRRFRCFYFFSAFASGLPALPQHTRSFPLAFCGGGGQQMENHTLAYVGIHYMQKTHLFTYCFTSHTVTHFTTFVYPHKH